MAASSTTRWVLAAVSLAWIAGIVLVAQWGWPRISLDLPARDPAVRAAYDAAVRAHVLWHAFLALTPPILLWLLTRIFRTRT